MEKIIINGLICEQKPIEQVKKRSQIFFLRTKNAKPYVKGSKYRKDTWGGFRQGSRSIFFEIIPDIEIKSKTMVYVVVMN